MFCRPTRVFAWLVNFSAHCQKSAKFAGCAASESVNAHVEWRTMIRDDGEVFFMSTHSSQGRLWTFADSKI